ncbi:MAG: GNAT family N-acetyltransferase [Candidatus Lokiarchaeota archaeon]|nr:GNAT family N-acetyltransferase [Candidatus Lokiarchaeota archaeon]
MICGEKIGIRLVESDEDAKIIVEARGNPKVMGRYCPPGIVTKNHLFPEKPNGQQNYVIVRLSDPTKVIGEVSCSKGPFLIYNIGFWIFPEFRHKGYCVEAVKIVADYLFLVVNTERLQCETHIENKIAQKTIEKIGFQKEGVLRKSYLINGILSDMIVYGLLRTDWKEPSYLKS